MFKKLRSPYFLLFLLILAVGVYLRNFQVVYRYEYAHDADLFSWIVKDIVVNHHIRLIGQLTSAPGIFIGPLYYYSLIPFFLLFNMDPIAAIIPISILGIFTIISYWLVFYKLFNKTVGLIAMTLYSVFLPLIELDRRVVPSTPTNIWVVWYFYAIISITRGNYSVLPLLGVLIGLIWEIHIALIPALIAIPVAVIVSKKLPKIRQVVYFFAAVTLTSIPLVLFEVRHNFQQTLSFIGNFTSNHGGSTGAFKFIQVVNMINKNVNTLLFTPQSPAITSTPIFTLVILLIGIFLMKKKLIPTKELLVLYIWFFGVVMFFTFSSSLISEYYFANLDVIFITIFSLLLFFIYRVSKIGMIIVFGLLLILTVKNIYFFSTEYTYLKGYNERKAVVDFISQDAKNKGYPCVAISYITAIGENVGLRYFLWLKGVKVVKITKDAPIYNVVIPDEYALGQIEKKFGHIGIITPKDVPSKAVIEKACQGENVNLTAPVFGFTE